MDDATATILAALSDNRNELTKAIGDLHAEFAGFKGNMEARVDAVETDQAKTEKRQWVHSCIVFAGSILHHDLGQWLHLRF